MRRQMMTAPKTRDMHGACTSESQFPLPPPGSPTPEQTTANYNLFAELAPIPSCQPDEYSTFVVPKT